MLKFINKYTEINIFYNYANIGIFREKKSYIINNNILIIIYYVLLLSYFNK